MNKNIYKPVAGNTTNSMKFSGIIKKKPVDMNEAIESLINAAMPAFENDSKYISCPIAHKGFISIFLDKIALRIISEGNPNIKKVDRKNNIDWMGDRLFTVYSAEKKLSSQERDELTASSLNSAEKAINAMYQKAEEMGLIKNSRAFEKS